MWAPLWKDPIANERPKNEFGIEQATHHNEDFSALCILSYEVLSTPFSQGFPVSRRVFLHQTFLDPLLMSELGTARFSDRLLGP